MEGSKRTSKLADMLTSELHTLRETIGAEIQDIQNQLRNKAEPPPNLEVEWNEYHDWRNSAVNALRYKQKEIRKVKKEMRDRGSYSSATKDVLTALFITKNLDVTQVLHLSDEALLETIDRAEEAAEILIDLWKDNPNDNSGAPNRK